MRMNHSYPTWPSEAWSNYIDTFVSLYAATMQENQQATRCDMICQLQRSKWGSSGLLKEKLSPTYAH